MHMNSIREVLEPTQSNKLTWWQTRKRTITTRRVHVVRQFAYVHGEKWKCY